MANNIINYDDERLTKVEREGQQRKDEVTQNYNNMINERDTYTQQQQQNLNDWSKQQTELQQANTAHIIDKINQQQQQAQKDYIREQKGAYVDYMKKSNQYGANAEQLARQGLQNSGFQESSQVSMWNTYQNRVASARETIQKSNIEFANAIKDAELANNEALAKIAQDKLQQSLQLALSGFEYKNNLIIQRDDKIDNINDSYNAKYQDVLNQINREYEYQQQQKEFEENQRRWAEEQEREQRQWEEEQKRWQAEFDLETQKRKDSYNQWLAEFELAKKQQEATWASLKNTSTSRNTSVSKNSGYTLQDSSAISQDDAQEEIRSTPLTANAKKTYDAYIELKNAPFGAGKSLTLENYLTKQYNKGKLTQNEVSSIIENYG